jgi:hypothetical protein
MNKPSVFVCADSGFVNTLLDIGHKIVAAHAQPLARSAFTFSMRDGSSRRRTGNVEEFLHRDELGNMAYAMTLPAVFLKNNGALEVWVTREEINRCGSLGDFERLVRAKLQVQE